MKKSIQILLMLIPSFIQAQFSEIDFLQLEDSILKVMEKNNIPGTQFAITGRDSTLWCGNLGYADIRNGIPVTDQTIFRIGSVTKSFTAAATMILVEQGKLSLTDHLRNIAPEVEYTNKWEGTDPVSIANLLEHTTGFDDIHLAEYAVNAEGWSTFDAISYHPDSRISRWKPGMHMSYCNSGPACVGYVIEKLTGMTYEDFINRSIFQPLGMEHSDFFNSDYVTKYLSVGYRNKEMEEAKYWHISGRPSGAINSTAIEMAGYIRMFLNRGRYDSTVLLSEASVWRMEHPQTTLAAKAGHVDGYGLNIVSRNYRGHKICGHNGGLDGYLTSMNYFPDLGLGFIFMINNSGVDGFSDIDRIIMDFIVPDSLEKSAKDFADTSLMINPKMLGWYRSATSRAKIAEFAQRLGDVFKLEQDDGKYYYKELFGERTRLYQLHEHVLFEESSSGKFANYVGVADQDNFYIQVPGTSMNYVRTSGFSVWFTMGVLGFCLLMLSSSLLAALVWVPISIFGKKKYRFIMVRIMPLLAVLFMIGSMIPFIMGIDTDMIEKLGTISASSMSYFIFTILFAVSALVSFGLSFFSFRVKMNKLARLHSLLISLTLVIITLYLLYFDMIGLRLWAY